MNEGNVLIKRNKELQTAHKEASESFLGFFPFLSIYLHVNSETKKESKLCRWDKNSRIGW